MKPKQGLSLTTTALVLFLVSAICSCDSTIFKGERDSLLSQDDGAKTYGEEERFLVERNVRGDGHYGPEANEARNGKSRPYVPFNSLTFMTTNSSVSAIDWTSTDPTQIRQHIANSKLAGVSQTSTIRPATHSQNGSSRLPPFSLIHRTTTKRPRTTTRWSTRPTYTTSTPFRISTINYPEIVTSTIRPETHSQNGSSRLPPFSLIRNTTTKRPKTTTRRSTRPMYTTSTPFRTSTINSPEIINISPIVVRPNQTLPTASPLAFITRKPITLNIITWRPDTTIVRTTTPASTTSKTTTPKPLRTAVTNGYNMGVTNTNDLQTFPTTTFEKVTIQSEPALPSPPASIKPLSLSTWQSNSTPNKYPSIVPLFTTQSVQTTTPAVQETELPTSLPVLATTIKAPQWTPFTSSQYTTERPAVIFAAQEAMKDGLTPRPLNYEVTDTKQESLEVNEPLSHWQSLTSVNYPQLENIHKYTTTTKPPITNPISDIDQKIIFEALDRFKEQEGSPVKITSTVKPAKDEEDTNIPPVFTVEQPSTIGLAPQQPEWTITAEEADTWTSDDDIIWHFDSDSDSPIASAYNPNISWVTNPRPQMPYSHSVIPTTTPYPALFEITSSPSTERPEIIPHRTSQLHVTTHKPTTETPPHTTSRQDLFTISHDDSHFNRNPILRPIGADLHNKQDLFTISQTEEVPSVPNSPPPPPSPLIADDNNDYDFEYTFYEDDLSEYYATYGNIVGDEHEEDHHSKSDQILDKEHEPSILETLTWPYTTIQTTIRPLMEDSSFNSQETLFRDKIPNIVTNLDTNYSKFNSADLSLFESYSNNDLKHSTNPSLSSFSPHFQSSGAKSDTSAHDTQDYASFIHNQHSHFNKFSGINSQQLFDDTILPPSDTDTEKLEISLRPGNNPHNLNAYNIGFLDTTYIPKVVQSTTTTRRPPILYTGSGGLQQSSKGTLSSDVGTLVAVNPLNPVKPPSTFVESQNVKEFHNHKPITFHNENEPLIREETYENFAHYGHVSQSSNFNNRFVQPSINSAPSHIVPSIAIDRNTNHNIYSLLSSPFLVKDENTPQIFEDKLEVIQNRTVEENYVYEDSAVLQNKRPNHFFTQTSRHTQPSHLPNTKPELSVTSSSHPFSSVINPSPNNTLHIPGEYYTFLSTPAPSNVSSIQSFLTPLHNAQKGTLNQNDYAGHSVQRIGITPSFESVGNLRHNSSNSVDDNKQSSFEAGIYNDTNTYFSEDLTQESPNISSSSTVAYSTTEALRPDNFSIQFTESEDSVNQSDGFHQHHPPTVNEIIYSSNSHDNHHLYVLVKIWSMVNGQLRLMGEQPVPTEMFQDSGLTNGAVVNPEDVPSEVLSTIASNMENPQLLSPVLGRHTSRSKRSLPYETIKDVTSRQEMRQGNKFIADHWQNYPRSELHDHLKENGGTKAKSALDLAYLSKAPRMVDGNHEDGPPVIHFIVPNLDEQPSFNNLLQRLAVQRQNQNQGQAPSFNNEILVNQQRPLPTNDDKKGTGNSDPQIPNFQKPQVSIKSPITTFHPRPIFGGIGNDDLPVSPPLISDLHAPSTNQVPKPSKSEDRIYFGGVGNQNYSNLPLDIGTTLNENNLGHLQILSQLADRIRNSNIRDPTLNGFISQISESNPNVRVPQPGYNSGGTVLGSVGIPPGSGTVQLLQTPSLPSEHRGSVLELLPSDLPHINPLLLPDDEPANQPVPLSDVLGTLPSATTLHREQLRNKLTSITGTNTFSGHLGNQGFFGQNSHASQNSVWGNYGQQALNNQLNPEVQTPRTSSSSSPLSPESLHKLSLLIANSTANPSPNSPSLLIAQHNIPVSFSQQQNNPSIPFQRPQQNQRIPTRFQQQNNPSLPAIFNQQQNNAALQATFNQQQNSPGSLTLQSVFPSLYEPSANQNINAPYSQATLPTFQQQTEISRPDVLSIIEQLQNPTEKPVRVTTQTEGSNLLPLQQPAALSPFDPSQPYIPFQSDPSRPFIPFQSDLVSDSNPLLSTFSSDTIDPTAATVSSSSVQGCVQNRACALGLASLLAFGVSNAIALPFLFAGRRRRQMDATTHVQSMDKNVFKELLTLAVKADPDFIHIISLTSDFLSGRPLQGTGNIAENTNEKINDYRRTLMNLRRDQIPFLIKDTITKISVRKKAPRNTDIH